mmetsp:Transcript_24499/g.49620  ORF Transcript_24499/g.49620 Transcript_24499/m.49620 type:complete len:262 (+) Transcript_24499:284-1069(+)
MRRPTSPPTSSSPSSSRARAPSASRASAALPLGAVPCALLAAASASAAAPSAARSSPSPARRLPPCRRGSRRCLSFRCRRALIVYATTTAARALSPAPCPCPPPSSPALPAARAWHQHRAASVPRRFVSCARRRCCAAAARRNCPRSSANCPCPRCRSRSRSHSSSPARWNCARSHSRWSCVRWNCVRWTRLLRPCIPCRSHPCHCRTRLLAGIPLLLRFGHARATFRFSFCFDLCSSRKVHRYCGLRCWFDLSQDRILSQ